MAKGFIEISTLDCVVTLCSQLRVEVASGILDCCCFVAQLVCFPHPACDKFNA